MENKGVYTTWEKLSQKLKHAIETIEPQDPPIGFFRSFSLEKTNFFQLEGKFYELIIANDLLNFIYKIQTSVDGGKCPKNALHQKKPC